MGDDDKSWRQCWFRIPEYQRTYDWSEEKISRLLEDAANGFFYLTDKSQAEDSFTFLGTIILVEEENKEPSFDGVSLAVVDGQQRLTTLLLTMCALVEALKSETVVLTQLPDNLSAWLGEEAEFQLNKLYQCIVGHHQELATTSPFPRIVRHEDTRGEKKARP